MIRFFFMMILSSSLLLIIFTSSLVVSSPSTSTTPSTFPTNFQFDDAASFGKVLVGPAAFTFGGTQNLPKGESADEEEITPRLFCFDPNPSSSQTSTSSTVYFDSNQSFACFSDSSVNYGGGGADGEPLDNCAGSSSSYGIKSSSFSSVSSSAAQSLSSSTGNGCGPWKFAPISNSYLNWNRFAGSDDIDDDGFTVTFGARCSSSTRGIAFAAVDNWYNSSNNVDLVTNTLQSTLEEYVTNFSSSSSSSISDSDVKLVNWDLTGIYGVYFAVYFDARENTILFASTNDDHEKLQILRYSAPAAVFDGQWHQIALVASRTEGAYSTIRLFIDASTTYSGDSRLNFQRCTESDLSTIIRDVSDSPKQSLVSSTTTETVYTGGSFSAFVGSSPPELFNLQFHKGALRTVELAGLGSQAMLDGLSLSAVAAIIIGSILGIVTLVILVMAICQVKNEALDDGRGGGDGGAAAEAGDFGDAMEAGQQASATLAAGAAKKLQKFLSASATGGGSSESFNMIRRLVALLTPLLAVFQQLALLFRGFRFPNLFEEPLSYITFIFSFQFNIPELGFTIPTWTPLALLCFVALVAVIIVLIFGWRDNEAFLQILKRYELLANCNAEYASQVVMSFVSTKDKAISDEEADNHGKALATNGWLLDSEVIRGVLGSSVSDVMAARLVKELGPRPRNPLEAIIRRALLITRNKSCPPDLARDVASLILSASAPDENENEDDDDDEHAIKIAAEAAQQKIQTQDPEKLKNAFTAEEFSSYFRKAGLSITKKEARFIMFETFVAANEASATDGVPLSGRSEQDLEDFRKAQEAAGLDPDDHDDMLFILKKDIACLSDDEQDGPSRDPEEKRKQNITFRQTALHLQVFDAPFSDANISKTHLDGRSWDAIIRAANNLASHGKIWPIQELELDNDHKTKLYNAVVTVPDLDEQERQESIKETGTAPPQSFSLRASIDNPKADAVTMRIRFKWDEPLRCPCHDAVLMKASDASYLESDENKKPIYECCHQSLSCIKLQEGRGPCRTDALFVCSADESCMYSICLSCADPGFFSETRIELNTSWVNLKRDPSAAVSLIAFLGLQGVYLPITQNAMMILACHPTTQCEYPTCFDPMSSAMMTAVIVSSVALGLVTVGLPLYWFYSISRRASLVARVFEDSPTQWEEFLEIDETALANLYNKFENVPNCNGYFNFIHFEPFLMVSRSVALVCAVAFTEPESLAQMISVAFVTLFNAVLLSYTAPFIDPWIDVLTKTDMLYSCGQVALLCVEQTLRIYLPGRQDDIMGIVFLAWGGFFFICYFAIFYKTIIRAYLDHRAVSKANEFEREELMWLNDSNIDRRLMNLGKVLEKKEDFFGKDHLQCAITRAHMAQSCRSPELQKQEADKCGQVLLETFTREKEIAFKNSANNKKDSSGDVLDQFTFRKSHWAAWSGGKGVSVLANVIRVSSQKQKIVHELTQFLHVAPHENAARTNAFSLLVTIRIPFESISFFNTNLTQVYARGAVFKDCNFTKANLMGVNFTGSVFTRCDFSGAFVSDATFGPDHKIPVQSVWSSMLFGVADDPKKYKNVNSKSELVTSVNKSGTRICVSGFDKYFVVLDAATGVRIASSKILEKPSAHQNNNNNEGSGINKNTKTRNDSDDDDEMDEEDDPTVMTGVPPNYNVAKDGAFKNSSVVTAVFVPARENEIFVYCKRHLYRVVLDEENHTISDFVNPITTASTTNEATALVPKNQRQQKKIFNHSSKDSAAASSQFFASEISKIQFSPSGDRFVVYHVMCDTFTLCETDTLQAICRIKSDSILDTWPFFTSFSENLVLCTGAQNGKEGTEAGYVGYLADISERIEKHLSLRDICLTSNESDDQLSTELLLLKRVDHILQRPVCAFEAPEKILYITPDGKSFVQFNPDSQQVSVRRFPSSQASTSTTTTATKKNDDHNNTFEIDNYYKKSSNNNNHDDDDDEEQEKESNKSNKKDNKSKRIFKNIPKSSGNLSDDTICSFKLNVKDPACLPMPDANTMLVVSFGEGGGSSDRANGTAKLFSLVSGAELGSINFSCAPPKARYTSYTTDIGYQNVIDNVTFSESGLSLDPSGSYLYVPVVFKETSCGVAEIYTFKIPLFFKEKSASRATIKTSAQNASRIEFTSDSKLVVLNDDFNFRVLDTKDELVELTSGSPSIAFDKLAVAPNSSNCKLAVLLDFSFVQLWNVETCRPHAPIFNHEEFEWNGFSELQMDYPTAACISENGELVAVGVDDEKHDVFVWSVKDQKLVTILRRPQKAKMFQKAQKKIKRTAKMLSTIDDEAEETDYTESKQEGSEDDNDDEEEEEEKEKEEGEKGDGDDSTHNEEEEDEDKDNEEKDDEQDEEENEEEGDKEEDKRSSRTASQPPSSSDKESEDEGAENDDEEEKENSNTKSDQNEEASADGDDDKDDSENDDDDDYDSAEIVSITFFDEDKHIFLTEESGRCAIFEVASGKTLYEGPFVPSKPKCKNVQLFLRGKLIFASAGNFVHIFSFAALLLGKSPVPDKSFKHNLKCASVSHDGKTLVASTLSRFKVYDIIYDQSVTNHEEKSHLLSGIQDFKLRVFIDTDYVRPKDKPWVSRSLHSCDPDEVFSVSPDGNQLAFLSHDHRLTVWDISGMYQYSSSTSSGDGDGDGIHNTKTNNNNKNIISEDKLVEFEMAESSAKMDASSQQQQQFDKSAKKKDHQKQQQQSNTELGSMPTTVYGTESSTWVLYRGYLKDPESRRFVRVVDNSKHENHEDMVAREMKECEQKVKRELAREERLRHSVEQQQEQQHEKNTTFTSSTVPIPSSNKNHQQQQQQNPASSSTTSKKKRKKTRAVKLHQKVDMIPASVCFRRIKTCSYMTKYLNNCTLQHVADFCTSPSEHDVVDHAAVDSYNPETQTHLRYVKKLAELRKTKEEQRNAQMAKIRERLLMQKNHPPTADVDANNNKKRKDADEDAEEEKKKKRKEREDRLAFLQKRREEREKQRKEREEQEKKQLLKKDDDDEQQRSQRASVDQGEDDDDDNDEKKKNKITENPLKFKDDKNEEDEEEKDDDDDDDFSDKEQVSSSDSHSDDDWDDESNSSSSSSSSYADEDSDDWSDDEDDW